MREIKRTRKDYWRTMDEKIKTATDYMRTVTKHEGRDWISPTEIGGAVGGAMQPGSFGSPICKEMVKRKVCRRNKKGHYRLIQRLT